MMLETKTKKEKQENTRKHIHAPLQNQINKYLLFKCLFTTKLQNIVETNI